ncbi:hypothetical protein Y032_0002g872 [Ancylostoma ceylanicum]|uniref:Uncharacterized protein n=1 Tax=Ancylostoma ceylanicum TaxID=53326 RepID=A0A016W1Z1_9BILA|nr:hypothetical protein Y032_0002g872 [Ancylostoma ceylanicum]
MGVAEAECAAVARGAPRMYVSGRWFDHAPEHPSHPSRWGRQVWEAEALTCTSVAPASLCRRHIRLYDAQMEPNAWSMPQQN